MSPTIRDAACNNTHQEYFIDFFGDNLIVTVTSTPSVIRKWIRNVIFNHRRSPSYHPLVVGVGVQWTPESCYHSPAETLQLCVGKRCIIIQLSHCGRVPDVLRSFLTSQETTFVGVWNSQDARKLEQCRHQLEIGQLLDVRGYVEDSEGESLSGCSFEEIVEACIGYEGVRLDPMISMSDWSVDDLDPDQILQVSTEAYVCFKLGVWARLWQQD
ncbi:unnamed protein product [Microthlaspi erraticum]|uniref:3'-5' exonuclease domain-containing protein n=1 Tax=Microthlaspi erraticum TaxID=1685480 RepID=A0A6D2KUM6_9BRAS|nr:unnamed protein product [Microthlaspi erraticum]